MQVASRYLLVWGIVPLFPRLAQSAGYSSMLLAWSVTEVIRYSYFVLTLSGFRPAAVSWLRYNTFYVLYPLGISSECWMIWRAVEPAKEWWGAYAYLLQLILFIYVPGRFFLVHTRVLLCWLGAGGWCVGCVSALRLICDCRFLCSVHAYDVTAKKGHEGEGEADVNLCDRKKHRNHGHIWHYCCEEEMDHIPNPKRADMEK